MKDLPWPAPPGRDESWPNPGHFANLRLNPPFPLTAITSRCVARVAAAAQRAGKTAHAFILEAISQTVEQVELDTAFNTLADQRWANIQATGKTVPWDDAKAY